MKKKIGMLILAASMIVAIVAGVTNLWKKYH
jgi:hypothetical protein